MTCFDDKHRDGARREPGSLHVAFSEPDTALEGSEPDAALKAKPHLHVGLVKIVTGSVEDGIGSDFVPG
jgi:hypothetical protein